MPQGTSLLVRNNGGNWWEKDRKNIWDNIDQLTDAGNKTNHKKQTGQTSRGSGDRTEWRYMRAKMSPNNHKMESKSKVWACWRMEIQNLSLYDHRYPPFISVCNFPPPCALTFFLPLTHAFPVLSSPSFFILVSPPLHSISPSSSLFL